MYSVPVNVVDLLNGSTLVLNVYTALFEYMYILIDLVSESD